MISTWSIFSHHSSLDSLIPNMIIFLAVFARKLISLKHLSSHVVYLIPHPFPFVISDYTPETSQDTPFFSPDVRRNVGGILLSIPHHHHHQIVLFLTLDITHIRFSVPVLRHPKNISHLITHFSKMIPTFLLFHSFAFSLCAISNHLRKNNY